MSPFRIFAMAVCTADSCQVNSLIATKHPKNHDDHDKNAALAKVTIQKAFKAKQLSEIAEENSHHMVPCYWMHPYQQNYLT